MLISYWMKMLFNTQLKPVGSRLVDKTMRESSWARILTQICCGGKDFWWPLLSYTAAGE
jgi:hypothetical protein